MKGRVLEERMPTISDPRREGREGDSDCCACESEQEEELGRRQTRMVSELSNRRRHVAESGVYKPQELPPFCNGSVSDILPRVTALIPSEACCCPVHPPKSM